MSVSAHRNPRIALQGASTERRAKWSVVDSTGALFCSLDEIGRRTVIKHTRELLDAAGLTAETIVARVVGEGRPEAEWDVDVILADEAQS